MKTGIEIVAREMLETLEIRVDAPAWRIPLVTGKSFKKIMEYMQELKIEPACAPYVRYMDIDWQSANKGGKLTMFLKMFTYRWSMCIGVPVKNKQPGKGDISAGSIVGGRFVRALHRGSYQKVGDTYKEMLAFVLEKNLRIKSESVEFYLNDPCTTKQNDLETEILIPLA